jgi:hypothetical protein
MVIVQKNVVITLTFFGLILQVNGKQKNAKF